MRPAAGTAGPPSPPRLGVATRWGLVVAALALGCVLVTARALTPDPSGHGTHTRLGLPPCGFFKLTGRRCPACGLTTAFAWAVRGRFDRAMGANPAGALLAPACAIAIPWLLACSASGRPRWGARSVEGPIAALTLAAAALAVAAWTFRLFLGRVLG